MKILVTGATGFIGSHLAVALSRDKRVRSLVLVGHGPTDGIEIFDYRCGYGPIVRDWKCDLTQEDRVKDLMLATQPDVIYHLAGNALIRPLANPCEISRNNILVTHYLLEHCPNQTRFVLASSAAVYGDGAANMVNELAPVKPNSVYGASKVAAENLLWAYQRLGKVSALCLRLVANVGKGATHGLLPDIIHKLLASRGTIDLLGDAPGSLKPYVHVSDTVGGAILFGMNRGLQATINLGSADCVTVKQVAEAAMPYLERKTTINWLGEAANWNGDNRVVRVDSSFARLLGWKPRFPYSLQAISEAVVNMIRT